MWAARNNESPHIQDETMFKENNTSCLGKKAKVQDFSPILLMLESFKVFKYSYTHHCFWSKDKAFWEGRVAARGSQLARRNKINFEGKHMPKSRRLKKLKSGKSLSRLLENLRISASDIATSQKISKSGEVCDSGMGPMCSTLTNHRVTSGSQ